MPNPSTPSSTPSSSTEPSPDDTERDQRERYEDIDLESGDDLLEGACGPYDAPTTNEEFSAVKKCNPGHDYGVCYIENDPVGKNSVIIGSSGDDVLEGTSSDEYICGMGGNDIIVGGGGEDDIWGGPGNDYIEGGKHGDFLWGGDGDDVIVGNNACLPGSDPKCGRDFSRGDDASNNLVDSGDDVILGGVVSVGEDVDAGPGNDIVYPTVARVTGHRVVAGDGNDVVMTLNFSHGGNADHVNLGALDGKVKLGVPINKVCNVTAELNLEDPTKSGDGKVACSLPWPKKFSKLDKVVPLTASIDQEGEVSMDATLYNKLANLSISSYRDMAKFQGSIGGDVCICDPLMNPGPTEPFMPYDFDTS